MSNNNTKFKRVLYFILKLLLVSFGMLLTILFFSLDPEFPASNSDTLIFKLSFSSIIFLGLVIPSFFLFFNKIRKRMSDFLREKISYIRNVKGNLVVNVLIFIIMSSIGNSFSAGIETMYSAQYIEAEKEYNLASSSDVKIDDKTDVEDKVIEEEKVEKEAEKTATTTETKSPIVVTETQYKDACKDIPWAEVVKDKKTYVGAYLKKDLMVRQIGQDSITGETVYICGEKKAENSYVGGTFTVYDRRENKSQPIKLYDKIYVYGKITGIYDTWSSYNPEFEVKYVQFNGNMGD